MSQDRLLSDTCRSLQALHIGGLRESQPTIIGHQLTDRHNNCSLMKRTSICPNAAGSATEDISRGENRWRAVWDTMQ